MLSGSCCGSSYAMSRLRGVRNREAGGATPGSSVKQWAGSSIAPVRRDPVHQDRSIPRANPPISADIIPSERVPEIGGAYGTGTSQRGPCALFAGSCCHGVGIRSDASEGSWRQNRLPHCLAHCLCAIGFRPTCCDTKFFANYPSDRGSGSVEPRSKGRLQ
jgi:hypothetical protein